LRFPGFQAFALEWVNNLCRYVLERLNRELLERVDGLTLLLKQTETKTKSAAAKARHYRERLSAAEARGYVPAADMATLPVVTSSRSATPTKGGGGEAGMGMEAGGEAGGGGGYGAESTGRMTPTMHFGGGAGAGGAGGGGGGGDPPAGRGYREAMQEKIVAAQEALKASEAQVAKHKRSTAQARAAANRAVDDAVRLTALCLQRGVELDDAPEPDAEFLAKAMESFTIDSQLEAIGLAKSQLVAKAARAAEGKRAASASNSGAAKKEKGWNDTGAVKNPLAAVSKDDNWRKQQIKAQGGKVPQVGGGGKKGGAAGKEKSKPGKTEAATAEATAAEATAAEGASEE
jgi:hypothetical protein